MERYEEAFNLLEENFKKSSNGRLFRLAKSAYEKGGRGAITMLYTNVDDAINSAGTAPAQFLPRDIVQAEDGDDVVEAVDEYRPHKEFVIAVSIGQNNDTTQPVVRKTFTIKYIGQKGEDMLEKLTMSLDEMENRLVGKKSWPCDWCSQRRKLVNLKRDPIVGKLVYCNQTCLEKHWSQGGAKLINWYVENHKKYVAAKEAEKQRDTLRNALKVDTSNFK